MKERPILFSGEMVKAILGGRKTQTRRIVRFYPYAPTDDGIDIQVAVGNCHCPYGKVGDRLWVKETAWYPPVVTERTLREGADTWPKVVYSADVQNPCDDFKEWGWKQKPSIFMPRWASRITLEITAIRVERVQDISPEDTVAEGVVGMSYQPLWDSINAKRGYSWSSNPWAWVVEFKQLAEEADR